MREDIIQSLKLMILKEFTLWLNIFSGESSNDTRLSLISILKKGVSEK